MAVNTPLINGKQYAGSDIVISMLGPSPIFGGVININYETERAVDFHHTIGAKDPTGYTEAMGKYTGDMEVTKEFYFVLKKAAGGNILDLPLFDMTLSFIKNGVDSQSEVLKNIKFTKSSTGITSGNDPVNSKLSFIFNKLD
jgi:hypothetical protein